MEDEQYFKMGKAYLYGENGLSKDLNKACENFLKSAENGNVQGLEYYDIYCTQPNGARLLQAIEKNGLQDEAVGFYIKALLLCGKTDIETQKKVLGYENSLQNVWDYLYFADFLDAIHYSDTAKIKKYYLAAYACSAVNTAKTMRSRMQKYGFESTSSDNIIAHDAQTLQCLQNNNRFGTVHFVKKEIALEMAQAIMEEHLSDFNKKIAEKLRAVKPEVILEYQRLYGTEDTVYDFSYSFQQEQSSSITTHSGSGSMELNKTFGTYKADFISDEDFTELLNSASYDETVPDARICLNEGHSSLYADMLENTKNTLEQIAQREVAKKYGWPSYSVEATVYHSDCNTKDETVSYFVPFYFFVFCVDGTTYTIRVNASNGKVCTFINNKFGLCKAGRANVGGKAAGKSKKKFSFGTFLLLTLFTGFGGILYAIISLCQKE